MQQFLLKNLQTTWPSFRTEATDKVAHSLHTIVQRAMAMKTYTFSSKHGPISYLKSGPGRTGETIIMFHGYGVDKHTFYSTAFHLFRDYQIIIPDLPGFGESFSQTNLTYDFHNYGEWLEEWMLHLDTPKMHLMGNSLGGAMALITALRCPERTQSLTMANPAGIPLRGGFPSFYRDYLCGANLFMINNRNDFEYFLDRVFHNRPHIPWPVKETLFKNLKSKRQWNKKLLNDLVGPISEFNDPLLEEKTLIHRLEEISCKTFIVWGVEDTLFPYQTGYFMQERIKHSQLHLFRNVGHSPQVEIPRTFCKVYKKFLESLN